MTITTPWTVNVVPINNLGFIFGKGLLYIIKSNFKTGVVKSYFVSIMILTFYSKNVKDLSPPLPRTLAKNSCEWQINQNTLISNFCMTGIMDELGKFTNLGTI